jgi:predicted nucleic acid-binding protein
MIVVDATVLADFLVGDAKLKAAAVALAAEDPEWISTSLWRYELGNVLWKKCRFEGEDRLKMARLLGVANAVLSETVEEVDTPAILEIATASGLTFYDASYVWLARSRGRKLRTRDDQILREYPDVAFPMPDA